MTDEQPGRDPAPPTTGPRPSPWSAWRTPAWDVTADAVADDPGEPVRPFAALVSFHYLRSAVRRRLGWCVLAGALGAVLGGAFLTVAPESHTATASVVLSHDPQTEPSRAMATDISLLASRTVAETVVRELALPVGPADLLRSVSTEPTTSDVVQIKLSAPSDAEAVRRLDAYVKAYLAFRAEQVSAQSDAVLRGLSQRVAALQSRIDELTKRIAASAGPSTPEEQERLDENLTQRAQLAGQIGSAQDTADDLTLRRAAVIAASRVVDPASVEKAGGLRRAALAVASGTIGGTAVALAAVILQAVVSDRLRLRVEVASALQATVRAAVGPLRPPSLPVRLLGFLPGPRTVLARRDADRQRAAYALTSSLPPPGRPQRLVVACIDDAADAAPALVAAAADLQDAGRVVHLVDLTRHGVLEPAARRLGAVPPGAGPGPDAPDGDAGEEGRGELRLVRPDPVPSLARAPAELAVATVADEPADGVRLVLAELDPCLGADHLRAWAGRAVVAVTAGRSGVDRVRTCGELVRAAGLDFHGALLLRVLRDDSSSGLYPPSRRAVGAGVPVPPDPAPPRKERAEAAAGIANGVAGSVRS